MACNYVPTNTSTSGDDLYGPRVCSQPFVNWAWDSFDFDKGDWDDGRGHSNVCDNRLPLNRAMSGIWCLTYSADNYRDESQSGSILQWGCKFARSAIDELDGVCVGGAVATTISGAFADDRTQLKIPFFDQAVSLRAGTLVHEARHADGKGHDSGSNDSSWGYNGAWRWQVCWLAWFNVAGTRTSAALKAMARQRGNNIINGNFATHPGFNI